MPPVDAGRHLLEYLWEIGPTIPAGFGTAAITHESIRAWQQNAGIELTPWEARSLRRLSAEYASESNQATKPGRDAPWQTDPMRKVFAAISMKTSILLMSD